MFDLAEAEAKVAALTAEIEQLEQELMLASGRAAALAAELTKCADELDVVLQTRYHCFTHWEVPAPPTALSMQVLADARAALQQK